MIVDMGVGLKQMAAMPSLIRVIWMTRGLGKQRA